MSTININYDEPRLEINRRLKVKPFKANPVPLTSRIPLYDHIMEDHRRKSALAKLNSAIQLQSQIKPFKFGNERPASSSRCLSRATSTPNLSDRPGTLFKATPCPKNLFSNYFYNKMWEDDYFRAMNRKIRAEEMLKISSLPPSMAKRADNYFSDQDYQPKKTLRRSRKRKGKKVAKDKDKDLLCSKMTNRSSRNTSSSCETTPIPSSYPVNRPNLAATLRVQSARQKVRELAKPKSIVPENRLPTVKGGLGTDRGLNGWGVKKAPAWRSMNYE